MTLNHSRATKLANKATEHRISSLINEVYTLSSSTFKVKVSHSQSLKKAQRDRIWSIYEQNMNELSKNSSFGWDPVKKQKEIFHSLSRFIVVHDEADTLLAFVMFRFEHENDEDMVYCYELQVAASAQGKGLGKKLLNDLERIGQGFSMEKIMLTVLKSNSKARSFYRSLGFTVDATSPCSIQPGNDPEDMERVDYEILSKVLPIQVES